MLIADAHEAVEEFEKLDRKCDLQQHLVEEVSNYAAKVTKEKNKLYRQSQALMERFADQLTVVDLKEITEDEPAEEAAASGESGAAGGEVDSQQNDRTALLTQIEGWKSTAANLANCVDFYSHSSPQISSHQTLHSKRSYSTRRKNEKKR